MNNENDKAIFDEDDFSLFRVEDRDLKARAIKNSIVPRLMVAVNETLALIQEAYGIDPLCDSTICSTPHFREGTKKVKLDYQMAAVGLGPVRNANLWKGVAPAGRDVTVVPISLRFLMGTEGMTVMLEIRRNLIGDTMASRIADMLCRREKLFTYLLTGVGGITRVWDADEKRWRRPLPFSNSLKSFKRNRHSCVVVYVNWLRAGRVSERHMFLAKNFFVQLSALYFSILELLKGGKDNFPQMYEQCVMFVSAQREKWNAISKGSKQKDFSREEFFDMSELAELAENRVRVMPGRRWRVFERDDWRCVSCGRSALEPGVVLEVDHIVPRSKGGEDSIDNYQTLCRECNIGKSNKSKRSLRKKP